MGGCEFRHMSENAPRSVIWLCAHACVLAREGGVAVSAGLSVHGCVGTQVHRLCECE